MKRKTNPLERWEGLLFFFLALFIASCTDELDTRITPNEGIEKVDLAHVSGEGQILTFSIPALEDCNVVLEDWMYLLKGTPATEDVNLQVWVTRNTYEKARRGKILFRFNNGQNKTYTLEQDILTEADWANPEESKARFGVGYGIDLSQEFSTKSIRGEVFQVKNLYNEGHIIKNTASQSTSFAEYTGETKREVGNKITVKAGVEGKFSGFSGEARAAFSMENTHSSNNQYAIMAYSSNKGTYEIDPTITEYSKFMSQNAIKSINDPGFDPQKLFEHFGTHVIMAAYEGARFNYDMSVDREKIISAVDISGFVRAGFSNKFVEAEVKASIEEKKAYQENRSNIKTKSRTVGGPINSSDLINDGKYQEWKNAIKEENWAMIGFYEDSLIPIWEFATDKSRSEKIEKAAIAYINSKWESESKKNIKITIPSEFGKTQVKTVRIEGVPYAEICNEYIPDISREQRQTVLYPINSSNGQIDYRRGFFIGNQHNKPSWIIWKDNKIEKITPLEDYPVGKLDIVYACGSNFTKMPYKDVAESKIIDEYCTCDFADNPQIGLVKLGTDIFARENTNFNRTREDEGFKLDHPVENAESADINISSSNVSFYNNKVVRTRFYGGRFAHNSPIPNDDELFWRPIGHVELNRAEDFVRRDKTKWYYPNGVSGLDIRFEGYLEGKCNDRRNTGDEEIFLFGKDHSISVVYTSPSRYSEIQRNESRYWNCAGSIRYMRCKTFFYNK